MHSRDLRWILLPVLCFAAYSQVETQTEENAIKKYGAPSFTRSSGGENLLYYVAQKHSPDFVLRINAGRVIEQMWSFTKRPLIVAEATVLFEIVRVDDVMSVNGSIELWINEIGWYAPWKKFDQQGRIQIIDAICKAALDFRTKMVLLPAEHPFVVFITGGHLENFLTDPQNAAEKTVDILSLINRFRKRLIAD